MSGPMLDVSVRLARPYLQLPMEFGRLVERPRDRTGVFRNACICGLAVADADHPVGCSLYARSDALFQAETVDMPPILQINKV
jgi:hypothetical protein